MFESLTALLHSNEEDERAQGLLLLSSLEPKSNEELTNAFTKVIDECTIEDGKLTPGSWLESCEYKYQMQTAMYILHYLQSPKQKEITRVSVYLLDDTLPPLPYVENLSITLDNGRDACTPKLDIHTELPSVHSLSFRGNYGGAGILYLPKINVPNLRSLEMHCTWVLDGLHHYTHATELRISCMSLGAQEKNHYVKHYMTENDITIPSVQDWYAVLQSYLDQTTLTTLHLSGIDKNQWLSMTIPTTVTNLTIQGNISSIANLESLKNLEHLYFEAVLQSAAELLPLSFLQSVVVGNTTFLPPLLVHVTP